MAPRKIALVLILLSTISLNFVPTAEAGFAIRLEKEVPQSAVKGTKPITASVFDSQGSVSPVATQIFGVGELMVSLLDTLSGAPQYRVRMDFTETDALTMTMDLYWEFSIGGNTIGKREKVPQSAFALFAAQATTALSAHQATTADTAVSATTAETVTGTVAEGNIDQAIARDSEVVNIVSTSSQFYSASEVDAMFSAYRQVFSDHRQLLRRNWLTLGTAELIETDDNGTALYPRVAANAKGDAAVVWQQSDGIRTNIWANIYAVGTGWGAAEIIESHDGGDAERPHVAIDPNGNAFAVWEQSDGTPTSVWANIYTAGTGWGTAELIKVDPDGFTSLQNVAVDDAGNAIAVWGQSDGVRGNIWACRYTVSSGWGSPELIETNDAGSAGSPHIAVSPAGDAVVVWTHSDGSVNSIWANTYVAGSGWGTAQLIESNDSADAWWPRVAVAPSGDAVVVWLHFTGDIWANTYTVGTGWGTPEAIEPHTGGAQGGDIAVDDAGNAVAVWTHHDGFRRNVWANTYTPGSGWGSAELIETDDAGGAGNIDVAVDASGNASAVWDQSDGTRDNIWANTYTPGLGWGAARLLETDDAGNAGDAHVAVDAWGNAIAVWQQSDGIRYNIWGNRF